MQNNKQNNKPLSHTRSLAFIGLSIALITISAWVSVPVGPVSFTLQIFAIGFALLVLEPCQCVAVLSGYILLGAIGLPVFSGMRGGVGVLLGPTGGYLWGFLLGSFVALALSKIGDRIFKDKEARGKEARRVPAAFAFDVAVVLTLIAVSYVCGMAQFMFLTGTKLYAAFMVTIAPFAVFDIVKAFAAVVCARTVRQALRLRTPEPPAACNFKKF